jgi:hypothetical protein
MKDCAGKKRLSWKCWPTWTCSCGVNVRVAIEDFEATCDKCGTEFVKKDK